MDYINITEILFYSFYRKMMFLLSFYSNYYIFITIVIKMSITYYN